MKQSRVMKHKDYLTLLSKAKGVKRRRLLIDLANQDEIKALSECFQNTLAGNVRLKSEEKKKLKRHRNTLRQVASKATSTRHKKKILQQKGGFLPMLLRAIGSVLPALLGRA